MKVCNILLSVAKADENPEKELHTISSNLLELSPCLAHLSFNDEEQHQLSCDFVQAVGKAIISLLSGENINSHTTNALASATSRLFAKMELQKHQEFKNALFAAVIKVTQEVKAKVLEANATNDAGIKRAGQHTIKCTARMANIIKLVGTIAEHIDVTDVCMPFIETVRDSNNELEDELPEATAKVEVSLQELEKALDQFPKSTDKILKDVENVLGDMKAELIANQVEESQEDSEQIDVSKFNKDILTDVLRSIDICKRLVAAAAALQRQTMKGKRLFGEEDVYFEGEFHEGLVSAALSVVRAIGALCGAFSQSQDGNVSKEYLMASAEHVSEC